MLNLVAPTHEPMSPPAATDADPEWHRRWQRHAAGQEAGEPGDRVDEDEGARQAGSVAGPGPGGEDQERREEDAAARPGQAGEEADGGAGGDAGQDRDAGCSSSSGPADAVASRHAPASRTTATSGR